MFLRFQGCLRSAVAGAAVLGFTGAASAQLGAAPAAQPGQVQYVERPGELEFSGELIARPIQIEAWIEQRLTADEAAAQRSAADAALSTYVIVNYVPQTDEYILQVPEASDENSASAALMATGLFQYVEPNWILYPIACPNDPLLGNQWHHNANRMQSCDGWGIHTGNPSVGVGICDTGVRTTHQDLQLHRLEGYNAVNQQWESAGGAIAPVHPHGTQTTGCAAANGNNGLGVTGVGWNLSHRMMRVSNVSTGSASLSVLQHAARTSIEAGDRVASVSYSGADTSSNLTTATYIKSIGGLLVWAAGNDNRNLTFRNRDTDDIIVVGATDQNDAKASFSAYGQYVDVVAPGVSIATTNSSSDSSYAAVSGTSFACPLTAGLVAMIWSADPTLTPNEVEAILKQSCEDLGAGGVDNTFGYGRINLNAAMVLADGGGITDCNGNGIDDATDISSGTSEDCNGNGIPDECDIAAGTSEDCNGNGIPDECDGGCAGGGPFVLTTFVSATSVPGAGTVAAEDIAQYDQGSGQWSLYFDGSDVGLSGFLIDGLAVLNDGSLLISTTNGGTIGGVSADDSDILRFVPTSLGSSTAGTWSLYFDGSDVGMTTNGEDIDAIAVLPTGDLLISTSGNPGLPGVTGLSDEDVVRFTPTSLGSATAGTWTYYFDGSDVGLADSSNEDVDAVSVTSSGDVLLSTLGSFSVSGLSGGDEDIIRFRPGTLGLATSGTYSMYLDLSTVGISTGADVSAVCVLE